MPSHLCAGMKPRRPTAPAFLSWSAMGIHPSFNVLEAASEREVTRRVRRKMKKATGGCPILPSENAFVLVRTHPRSPMLVHSSDPHPRSTCWLAHQPTSTGTDDPVAPAWGPTHDDDIDTTTLNRAPRRIPASRDLHGSLEPRPMTHLPTHHKHLKTKLFSTCLRLETERSCPVPARPKAVAKENR
jgi:hypothetical protein